MLARRAVLLTQLDRYPCILWGSSNVQGHAASKSHGIISFADPYPLTPLGSYRFKNSVGPLQSFLQSSILLISLDATLLNHLACVAIKGLMQIAKPFRCNTY